MIASSEDCPKHARSGEGDDDQSSDPENASRKRRRQSRKGASKRFVCTLDNCGKTYSRQEHLERHQLNHAPKEIFKCEYPNCERVFVRQDLCTRHQERHSSSERMQLPRLSLSNYQSPAPATVNHQDRVRKQSSDSHHSPPPHVSPPLNNNATQVATSDMLAQIRHLTSTPSSSNYFPPVGDDGQLQESLRSITTAATSHDAVQMQPSACGNSEPDGEDQHIPGHYRQTIDSNMNAVEDFHNSSLDMMTHGDADFQTYNQTSMPSFFGGESLNRSPFAISDDFLQYLFNDQDSSNAQLLLEGPGSVPQAFSSFEMDQFNWPSPEELLMTTSGFNAQGGPMDVASLLEAPNPSTSLSDERAAEIIAYIRLRFQSTDPASEFEPLLLDNGVVSRRMMEVYVESYWRIFHPQLPILHKPTFSAESAPVLLLLAMIAIGAAIRYQPNQVPVYYVAGDTELPNFLIDHLRWELFRDVDFRPPAKLWVFQALLLVEVYEKISSSRIMHERAHIHHATTITLMRRGSLLLDHSSLDSPVANDLWAQWILKEGTRRTAFAAFMIDSLHTAMFGHSTIMVAHEMRLSLPCDEVLWSATSIGEVSRIEASLRANGVKPLSFLEGLQRTLNSQEVRTNPFGRSVLMAGLLNVSWHMTQRDLQISSLGVSHSLGTGNKWRKSLTRAFDHWKEAFDRTLPSHFNGARLRQANLDTTPRGTDLDSISKAYPALYHLAYLSMHVDLVDCQVFARAKRVLGRVIGPQDFIVAQRRIKEDWAPSERARIAVFYALRYLTSVLATETTDNNGFGARQTHSNVVNLEEFAQDDAVVKRTWVLHVSALVVWCYGFALEGPYRDSSNSSNSSAATARSRFHGVQDEASVQMKAFLERFSGVRSPDQLKEFRGMNGCGGLLTSLRIVFRVAKWELLREAGEMLGGCARMLEGP